MPITEDCVVYETEDGEVSVTDVCDVSVTEDCVMLVPMIGKIMNLKIMQ